MRIFFFSFLIAAHAAACASPAPPPGKSGTRVVPATITIRGPLEKEQIGAVIRARLPEAKTCYDAELAKKPDIEGLVEIAFKIDPRGAVTKAELASTTLHDEAVQTCVIEWVKTLVFPEPRDGGLVDVTYPFYFASK